MHALVLTAVVTFQMHRVVMPSGVQAVATDGERVYIVDYAKGLHGFSRAGVIVFRKKKIALEGDPRLDVVAGTVVVSSSEVVIAFDAKTGKQRWKRHAVGNDMFADVQYDHGAARVAGDAGVEWVDLATGRAVKAPTSVTRSRHPVLGTENDVLVAQDPQTHQELWRLDPVVRPSMAIVTAAQTDELTFAIGPHDTLIAVDTMTGQRRWQTPLYVADGLRHAYPGPGFYWIVMTDADRDRHRDVFRAVQTDAGSIVSTLALPTDDVRYCTVGTKWSSDNGVLAVAHAIKSKNCSTAVIDIYVPGR